MEDSLPDNTGEFSKVENEEEEEEDKEEEGEKAVVGVEITEEKVEDWVEESDEKFCWEEEI